METISLPGKIFYFPTIIKEMYLDTLGHMNNAMYLVLFEEARWEFITKHHFGLKEILASGIGPTILEINIQFHKELKLRDSIIIESQVIAYSRKVGKLQQRILRGEEKCCTAEITLGLFDLNTRKLISPTQEWLNAIGLS